jgi:hypothetical protein
VLGERSSLLVLDQKGDHEDVEQMRPLAVQARVPFGLFDSQDESTNRWQVQIQVPRHLFDDHNAGGLLPISHCHCSVRI